MSQPVGKCLYSNGHSICTHRMREGDNCKDTGRCQFYQEVDERSFVHPTAIVPSEVRVDDLVWIGPYVVFETLRTPRQFTTPAPCTGCIKKGATVGASSVIMAGVEIGAYAVISPGSVVTRNVPSFASMAGNPAKQTGIVCVCGRTIWKPGDHLRFPLCCSNCNRSYTFSQIGEQG